MAITSVTKSEGYLIIVKDGITYRRSIVYEDAVCSLPPTGYEEVGVVYVDHANGQLIVQYNGNTLTLSAAGVTAHDLGGAPHTADTLADLNTKVSDDNLLGQGSILAFILALGG